MLNKYKYSILYVETDKLVSSITLECLNRYFTTIYHTDDGKEAFQIYKNRKPDIIITAIKIPKINGLELSYNIRKDNKKIPIIALTSNDGVEDICKTKAIGMNAHLSKPIEPITLYEAFDKYINVA